MGVPSFAIGDVVQFASSTPFYNGTPMIVLGIQYMNENGEFVDEVTEYFQYRLGVYETSAVEVYLELAP